MNCPKCQAAMEKVTFEGIEVDRCTSCKGIWFDVLEKEHLNEMKGSEQIDIGEKPADASTPHRILCPVCKTQMISMSVVGHPGLKYESCTVCFGAFFDAGELREFKGGGGLPRILKGLVGLS
jgi:Zn-finger nucleic acid-binding protein